MARREITFIMRFLDVVGSILAPRIVTKEEAAMPQCPFRFPTTPG
jgi:hypothetical protein